MAPRLDLKPFGPQYPNKIARRTDILVLVMVGFFIYSTYCKCFTFIIDCLLGMNTNMYCQHSVWVTLKVNCFKILISATYTLPALFSIKEKTNYQEKSFHVNIDRQTTSLACTHEELLLLVPTASIPTRDFLRPD